MKRQGEELVLKRMSQQHGLILRSQALCYGMTSAQLIGRVDLAYPDRNLAIELDSVRWHHNLHNFSHDRQRHNQLLLAGWDVLNFTWDDYSRRPDQLCAAVAAAGAPLEAARPKSVEKHVI